MSSLYIKHRPQDWADVVGNEDVVEILKGFPNKPTHPHTFLFTGPSGTGKTTLARILARHFGASNLDIKEVNSSNNRGIDTAREIQDQMRFAPDEGQAKVWIIDEVHKTTNDWQNAMLKPLEDTPDHVYFFLCTTDPQKLIGPLKTRTTEIALEALTDEQVVFLLRKVLRAEKIKREIPLLEAIAERAGGSPRAALVLLEKVLDIEDTDKAIKVVNNASPDEAPEEVISLCRLLMKPGKETWPQITEVLKGLKEDPETIRHMVLGYMQAILLKGANGKAAFALEMFCEPFYNSNKPGLTLACYQVCFPG